MTNNPPKRFIANPYLQKFLEPIAKYFEKYADEGLIEVCINRPGEIWIETKNSGWRCIEDEDLNYTHLNYFAEALARVKNQAYDQDKVPFLFTDLPGYGYRVTIAGRGVVESGFAMSIRCALASTFPLESYFGDHEEDNICTMESVKAECVDGLKRAVKTGMNLIVAGGTNSGKTTFINGLIREIPAETRVIVIEDTAELQIPHKNSVRLIKSKTDTDLGGVRYKHLINLCMRLRPDRLILGEMDTDNVLPFLRILNTGHGGCISSLHAESPELVHDAMAQNAAMSPERPDENTVRKFAQKVVRDVVYLKGNARIGIRAKHVHF